MIGNKHIGKEMSGPGGFPRLGSSPDPFVHHHIEKIRNLPRGKAFAGSWVVIMPRIGRSPVHVRPGTGFPESRHDNIVMVHELLSRRELLDKGRIGRGQFPSLPENVLVRFRILFNCTPRNTFRREGKEKYQCQQQPACCSGPAVFHGAVSLLLRRLIRRKFHKFIFLFSTV